MGDKTNKQNNYYLRQVELTKKATGIVDHAKKKTRIPIKYLVEEAIINWIPKRYGFKPVGRGFADIEPDEMEKEVLSP